MERDKKEKKEKEGKIEETWNKEGSLNIPSVPFLKIHI